MSDIELDYDYLGQKALRQVIADVLQITADLGEAPGEHHFYIEFLTHAPGVSIPEHLRAAYPERMTIVLQHQFEDLIVTTEGFSVTLWFRGKQADLRVPFSAVSSFADPSVEFGLRFEQAISDLGGATPKGDVVDDNSPSALVASDANEREGLDPKIDEKTDEADSSADEKSQTDSADVVSLDSFRKK